MEVSAELPWLENDDWLEAGKASEVRQAEPEAWRVAERRAARAETTRTAPSGYARVAVLIVLLTELAWCGFLLSLGYRFVS
jgi:hypothetical protein